MNIPRFFIEAKYINKQQKTVFCQDAKLTKQIRKVLRLGNGSKIDVLDGNGNIYHCLLQIIPGQSPEDFQAQIDSHEKLPSLSNTSITVGLPLIKPNRFDWALEKVTELGADTIIPIALHRSIIKISPQNNSNRDSDPENKAKFIRWQKIIQEASEQCERPMPPRLVPPLTFQEWLEKYFAKDTKHEDNKHSVTNNLRLICAERQNAETLETVLYNQKIPPNSCAIALGAEGGFIEEEIKLALSYEFIPVSLGPLILRSETAAVYTLAVINAVLRLNKRDITLQ